mmetsp:Transcript_83943/g.166623  ORF Transcript_83943/g.166623 Transcript_83943/m.166623 type:complete len:494 (+) Transcript_83943:82-1563(+)|eukprot:CAMPEP_0172765382 /NCGR_PEP_ID=MMETSP1074-20121228/179150_1 /TAXON_ID=2916 /ORGANISM="Ceratium fusus, Strain PA161109" /LENGTH=493 /DNA_ID=CAMNT_0013600323 /DNA_START=40 /DNA_END=1521 /DNA_ORIENTATION=+
MYLARSVGTWPTRHGIELLGRHRFANLTAAALPKSVLDCDYAVRGDVLIKAGELQTILDRKDGSLPFSRIVPCNIGNPQAVGARPLNFYRQVIACLAEPSLIDHDGLFASDVRERAQHFLSGANGKLGAYSDSKGHLVFRKEVAKFLEARDGFAADPEHIFLSDGASPSVKLALQLVIGGKDDGVLLPIPQYPLYSASMTLLGGQAVGYFLDESSGWGTDVKELERSISEFRAKGGTPRALVVINPGNPTGGVLPRSQMEAVIRVCEQNKMVLLADEVYQDNIYADNVSFVPFRKVVQEMGSKIELFSFHSVSKGVVGECGLRGGFVHCHNVEQGVIDQMYKLCSVNLCSNTLGQAAMALSLTGPPANGPSRAAYEAEKNAVRGALKRKARMTYERLNAVEGISCQPIAGAMYAFPKIEVKGEMTKKAASLGKPVDAVYCMELLLNKGIVVVPGSGFGQVPGTFHFRTTILPDEDTLANVLDSIADFHKRHAS